MKLFRRRRPDQEIARLQLEARLQADLAAAAVGHLAEMRRQYEQRIADLKEAHEQRQHETLRTVKALAEEIEYLRAQHFGPHATTITPAAVPVLPEFHDFMPDPSDNPHFLSEEDEELEALRAGGHLDPMEYRQALSQLRASVGGVPLQIEPS